jgi:hypothetical protein
MTKGVHCISSTEHHFISFHHSGSQRNIISFHFIILQLKHHSGKLWIGFAECMSWLNIDGTYTRVGGLVENPGSVVG